MRYKDIRKIAKIKPINEEVFAAYFFSRRLSPFVVNIFKTKYNPKYNYDLYDYKRNYRRYVFSLIISWNH